MAGYINTRAALFGVACGSGDGKQYARTAEFDGAGWRRRRRLEELADVVVAERAGATTAVTSPTRELASPKDASRETTQESTSSHK